MSNKPPNIGLKQAKTLCGMTHEQRLGFIAEGLPLILKSAQDYWAAAEAIKDRGREAQILAGFSAEEAAKIMILMDVVRCPRKCIASCIGPLMTWLYEHLARLADAKASNWRPVDTKMLKDYMRPFLKSHYIEGAVGEYILPNSELYERESNLYVDIAVNDDADPYWNTPLDRSGSLILRKPEALSVAEAMSAVGLFSLVGLKVVHDVWGQVNFNSAEDFSDAQRLTKSMLKQITEQGLATETVTQDDVNKLYCSWQLPMYNFDLKQIPVSLDELKAEQDHMLWREMGY